MKMIGNQGMVDGIHGGEDHRRRPRRGGRIGSVASCTYGGRCLWSDHCLAFANGTTRKISELVTGMDWGCLSCPGPVQLVQRNTSRWISQMVCGTWTPRSLQARRVFSSTGAENFLAAVVWKLGSSSPSRWCVDLEQQVERGSRLPDGGETCF